MSEIIEVIKILEKKSIEEIEVFRDGFIAEFGDSENHIVANVSNAVIEKKKAALNT